MKKVFINLCLISIMLLFVGCGNDSWKFKRTLKKLRYSENIGYLDMREFYNQDCDSVYVFNGTRSSVQISNRIGIENYKKNKDICYDDNFLILLVKDKTVVHEGRLNYGGFQFIDNREGMVDVVSSGPILKVERDAHWDMLREKLSKTAFLYSIMSPDAIPWREFYNQKLTQNYAFYDENEEEVCSESLTQVVKKRYASIYMKYVNYTKVFNNPNRSAFLIYKKQGKVFRYYRSDNNNPIDIGTSGYLFELQKMLDDVCAEHNLSKIIIPYFDIE